MFLSLTFAVLLGEVCAHLLWPQRENPKWFVLDDRYGYFHRKNYEQLYRYQKSDVTWTARLNELGLRGDPYGGPRPGEKRVLCIGDSFTFGYGLDEDKIFPTRLQRKLNEEGQTWRVINAGVGGWGPIQETMYARDHFDLFKPDVVVLTACDNDLDDDILFLSGRSGGLLPAFPGKRFLRDNSHLYRLLYRLFSNRLFAKDLPAGRSIPSPTHAAQPVEGASVAPEDKPPADPRWATTGAAIAKFHKDFKAFNPHGRMYIQLAQPYRADFRAQVSALANGTDLVFVDLLPDLETLTYSRLLLPYDPHWTEDMHEISATRLRENIVAREDGAH